VTLDRKRGIKATESEKRRERRVKGNSLVAKAQKRGGMMGWPGTLREK